MLITCVCKMSRGRFTLFAFLLSYWKPFMESTHQSYTIIILRISPIAVEDQVSPYHVRKQLAEALVLSRIDYGIVWQCYFFYGCKIFIYFQEKDVVFSIM